MKLKLKAGIILGLLSLLGVAAQPTHAAPPAGYTLLWSDEFNSGVTTPTYPSGDSHETLGAVPDPAFWSFDTGNNGGWGNNEIETYTTTNATIVTDAGAANGSALDINAVLSAGHWSSGRIKTSASSVLGTQPQYGYLESQISAPSGSGLWPKWWAQGVDVNAVGWPEAGELDLAQVFGAAPLSASSSDIFGTTAAYQSYGGSVTIAAGYNVYGFLWTPTEQANYINGYSVSVANPPLYNSENLGGVFNQPFYLLYDLAVGSASSPGGGTGVETTGDLKVGYVRVYQPAGHLQTASNSANNSPTVLAGGSHPIANGTYQVTPQIATGFRLDLTGNDTTNGNGIDAAAATSPTTASESWTFSSTGVTPAGDYNVSVDGPYCLQAGGWFPGAYAEIWGCNGSSLQSWNAVASNAGDYQLQMAVIPPLSEETPAAAALCLYDESGIFQLETCDTTGADELTILPLTPSSPTGLSATASAGGTAPIILNWTATAGALVYRVYRSTTSGGEGTVAIKGGIGTNTYSDTSTLTAGSKYYYEVTAVSAGGASGSSNEASATLAPAAPATLTATAAVGGYNPVTLNWVASAGATSYNLFRGTTLIDTTGTLTFSDTAAATGVANTYTVSASNAGGTSATTLAAVTLAPAAPAGLAATAGQNQVTLNWTASTGTLVYRVYRATSPGGETILKGGLTATTFTDTAAPNGTTFYYEVTAVNNSGASPLSSEAHATPGSLAPLPPTGLSATASAGGVGPVTLNWTASANTLVYRVYRATSPGGEGTVAIKGGLAGTTFSDTGAFTAGLTYYYEVTAVNNNGASAVSNEAHVLLAPAAPAGLTGTSTAGYAPVTLNWTADTGATSYTVYRGTVSLGSAATNTFSDTSVVAAGVSVSYTVTASNAAGTSAASAAANVLLGPVPPAALTATGGATSITLNWTASPGSLVYRVYRATSSGGETLLKGGVGSATFSDTAAALGTTYFYKVTAVNNGGASGFSNEASAATNSIPLAPASLTATASAGGVGPITLNWSASVGATVYRVYRATSSGGEAILKGGITGTTYSDTSTLTAGITFYYEVTAVNTSGASGFSPEASVLLAPPAPTGLTSTATAGGNAPVTLNWTASTGATGYTVYRGTVNLGSTAAITFSDTSVVPAGVAVSYTVTATNTAGTSPASSATNILLHPAAPLGLTATAGVNEVFLNWTASTGTTVYRVYRATTSGHETLLIGGIGSPTYTDTSAVNTVTYFYEVTAASTAGASGFSNEASATPGVQAPATNLTATASPGGHAPIILGWTAAPGASFYRIYRSTVTNTEGNPDLATNITSTAYTDNAVSAGTTYFYKVTAVSGIAASVFSNEASATLAPAAPNSLTGTGGTSTITLNWLASTGATSYGVYRGGASGLETLLVSQVGTNFTDTSVTPGTVYYYKVNASNTGGTSQFSNEIHLQTSPAGPTLTSVTAAGGGVAPVTVTWTAVANATGYLVYRSTSSGTEALVGPATSPYSDTSANAAGATYYYEVAAVNAGGESPLSNELSATLTPSAPATVSAANTAGGAPVVVTFTASAGAASYIVYRGPTSGSETQLQIGVSSSPYSDTSANAAGNTYYYTVASVNTGGTSAQSASEGSATLAPPSITDLSATATVGGVAPITLNWTATNGSLSYAIWRGTSTGTEVSYDTSATNTYTDTDPSLTAGVTYYYTVYGSNTGGTSGVSNEANAALTPAIPGTPSVNTVISADNAAALSWTASTGATGYNVYRSTSSGGETLYDTTSSTSYTDTAATQTTYGAINYYYTVTAVNVGGESGQSGESAPANPCDTSITTDQPTGLAGVADASPGIVDLTWTSGTSDDLLGYQTYASDVSDATDPFPNDFGNSGSLSSTSPTSGESAQDNFGTTLGSPGALASGTPYYFDVTEGDQCGVYSTLNNGVTGPVTPN